MGKLRLLVIILAVCNSVWMIFDGLRALTTGNYTVPSSGEYAGQLGPWAKIISYAGISPHSTFTKLFFVIYGLCWLIAAVYFYFEPGNGIFVMLFFAVVILWYAPIGSFFGLLQLILLLILLRYNT